jgi:hypothetical protein
MAVILVLALLSITLALSYAMMRTEATVATVQRNYGQRGLARQAAMAGMSIGLRKLHEADWTGVDVDLNGELGGGMLYQVTYETGDASLTPTDPDYSDYPYRVTVTSTGTATDAGSSGVQATHTTQAVVQLVPRKLSDPPANWASLQPYTVYQWGTGSGRKVDLEAPARVEGPVFFQNEIDYLDNYPNDGDDKPFDGNIDEVAIFGTALTSSEIDAVQQGTSSIASFATEPARNPISWWRLDEAVGDTIATDVLGNHHGRYDGGKPGAAPAPSQGGAASASFDGFDDHIDLSAVDVGGSAMTILARFKADSFNYSDGRIISKATSTSTSSHYWMLSTIKTSGHYRLRFRLKTTSGGTSMLHANSGDLSTGVWVFAAAVYDGSQMKLYKNGQLVGSKSKSGTISTNSTVLASIGNNPPGSPRARLLRDLEAMRVAGEGDFRPFTGLVNAPLSLTSSRIQSLLSEETNLPLNDVPEGSGAAPLAHPGDIVSYQLYPGGKAYSPQSLASSLTNASYAPDIETNPLGLFKRQTELQLHNDVTIQGTLLTYDSGNQGVIQVRGTNVNVLPFDLPLLYGDSTKRQLPSVIAGDDVEVHDGSSSSLQGMIMAWDDLECFEASQATSLSVAGRVVVAELELQSRSEWNQSSSWWKSRLRDFLLQLDDADAIAYFPKWIKHDRDLDYEPKLSLKPDPAGVSYHWPDWSEPLFQAHPDDGGLRWDLIDWRDNP